MSSRSLSISIAVLLLTGCASGTPLLTCDYKISPQKMERCPQTLPQLPEGATLGEFYKAALHVLELYGECSASKDELIAAVQTKDRICATAR